MAYTRHFSLIPALAFFLCQTAFGQLTEPTEEDINFNYVYGAVLGTGFYKSTNERVFILRVPLNWQLIDDKEKHSLKLMVPVAVGMRDILEDGEFQVPDRLKTLSILPGLAYQYRAKDNWLIVPTLQTGAAHDFENHATAWLYSGGVRSFAWWDVGNHRISLGNRLRGAGQHIRETSQETGFILLENGVDWEYPLPLKFGEHAVSGSVYVLWQSFLDDLNINGVSGEQVNITNLYELGFTFGFRETVKWGFIPLSRFGFSIGRGNTAGGAEIKAFTLNLGFPLSYD